jgi:hypothetical protein
MATCVLETLELNELYIRKEHLLLQLILVDKQIKKILECSNNENNNKDNNENNIIPSSNITKKITIRIKKK